MGAALSRGAPPPGNQHIPENVAYVSEEVEVIGPAAQASEQDSQNGQDAETPTLATHHQVDSTTNTQVPLEQTAIMPSVAHNLPYDIELIVQAGLHKDGTEKATSNASAVGVEKYLRQDVQNAVGQLREKFGINKPMTPADQEQISVRKELNAYEGSLRERLMKRRQAQPSSITQSAIARADAAEQTPANQKGKERSASISSGSSDDDEEADNSSSEGSASSSSSSGSSLNLRPSRKRKIEQVNGSKEDESDQGDDEDDDDDEEEPSSNRALKRAIGSGASVLVNPLFASKNEILDLSAPVSAIDKLPPDSLLYPFGTISTVIDSVIVIRAGSTGEVAQILDEGSLACLEDGTVVGPIFETFGAVTAPMYSVRMPSSTHPLIHTNVESQIDKTKLLKDGSPNQEMNSVSADSSEPNQGKVAATVAPPPVRPGVQVFYCPSAAYSKVVYTRDVRLASTKGSDASNLYDEEPAAAEVEFSDDEQEHEQKQAAKQQRRQRAVERREAFEHEYGSHNPDEMTAEFEFDDDDDTFMDDARPLEAGLEEDGEAVTGPVGADLKRDPSDTFTRHAADLSTPVPQLLNGNPLRSEGHLGRQHDNAQSHTQRSRGRGDGRSRGRGTSAGRNNDGPGRPSRGFPRDASSRGRSGQARGSRGRGNDRRRDTSPSRMHQRTTSFPLPMKPVFQHPDALPYDNVLPYGGPVSPPAQFRVPVSHTAPVPLGRPIHSLPPRPVPIDEAYNPTQPSSSFDRQASPFAPRMTMPPTMPPQGFTPFGPAQTVNPLLGYNPSYQSSWNQPGYTPLHAKNQSLPSTARASPTQSSPFGGAASQFDNTGMSNPPLPSVKGQSQLEEPYSPIQPHQARSAPFQNQHWYPGQS